MTCSGIRSFQSLPFVRRPASAAPGERLSFGFRPVKERSAARGGRRLERESVTDPFTKAGGNLSQAARIAGLAREFLYKLVERAGIEHFGPARRR